MNWHSALHKRNSIISGFTLLEVLVAMVIFSIGLLGLAGLQIISLKLSGDSLLRTIATIQANDMIDRMRANVTMTSLGKTSPYNNPSMTSSPNPSCMGMNNSGTLINAQCTPAQLAGQDFFEWYANLSGAPAAGWHIAIPANLPSGAGVVCIDSTPFDGTPSAPACDNIVAVSGKPLFAIKIWWTERTGQQGTNATHSYITTFSL